MNPEKIEETTTRFRELREAIESGDSCPHALETMQEAIQCLAWLFLQTEARKVAGVARVQELRNVHSRQLVEARSRRLGPGGVG